MNIPLTIPNDTPQLKELSSKVKPNWLDGPHALTEIRNSLVHPDKQIGQLDSAYDEAWNLGLWYLERGLLALCNYSGTYGNRLKTGRWIGQVEDVSYGI